MLNASTPSASTILSAAARMVSLVRRASRGLAGSAIRRTVAAVHRMAEEEHRMSHPIPAPRGLPVVGNGLQVPVEGTYQYFTDLAARHPDGIFKLNLAGRHVVLVYHPDLVAEVCDESRFYKPIDPPLAHVRDFAGDGLFTARDGEESWGQAHRILLPAFSQRSMKAYFPQFLQVAEDLVAAWERRTDVDRSEEHTSELQSRRDLVCRLLLEKKKKITEEKA